MKKILLSALLFSLLLSSCDTPSAPVEKEAARTETGNAQPTTASYKEGRDYQVYERVRLLDKVGFTEPQEAYSILLPKGWQTEGDIVWNGPGTTCAGTFRKLKAASADGRYAFELYPDIVYSWNTNPELMQFNQSNGASAYCDTREPLEAESYLRNIFAAELGNPEIVTVEPNADVVSQMQQHNAAAISELQQYGAGQMNFNQTAINARLRWNDGKEGLVTLGVTILEMIVPNTYNGTYSKLYTTQITKRTLFTYPSSESEAAKSQYSVIMSSFRTNPAWNDAVNRFWKEARQQSHTVHVGRIRMMDEQTRRMGEQAIRNGQERLRNMDVQMRSWEQQQNAQDRMHTEFIKTIRGVENFRDESGKYEMTAGYDHVWSRGDGNSFVLSDNVNFDAASVFQDQGWKKMEKVD